MVILFIGTLMSLDASSWETLDSSLTLATLVYTLLEHLQDMLKINNPHLFLIVLALEQHTRDGPCSTVRSLR